MKIEESIGSTGFAQFGQSDYHEKSLCEKTVLMNFFQKHHPVPDALSHFTSYKWKECPYDGGFYYELFVISNKRYLSNFEDDPANENAFYAWLDELYSEDIESDKFIEMVKAEYRKQILSKEVSPALLKIVA